MISFCLPAGPTKAVRISAASSLGGEDMKSESDGPALIGSRKKVCGRRDVYVGGAVGSVGSETAVAKLRVEDIVEFIGLLGAAYRQRKLITLEAIL